MPGAPPGASADCARSQPSLRLREAPQPGERATRHGKGRGHLVVGVPSMRLGDRGRLLGQLAGRRSPAGRPAAAAEGQVAEAHDLEIGLVDPARESPAPARGGGGRRPPAATTARRYRDSSAAVARWTRCALELARGLLRQRGFDGARRVRRTAESPARRASQSLAPASRNSNSGRRSSATVAARRSAIATCAALSSSRPSNTRAVAKASASSASVAAESGGKASSSERTAAMRPSRTRSR